MRRFFKLLCTTATTLALIAVLSIFASASDFEVSKAYFESAGQSETFFADKSASSDITRGEAALFLEDFIKDSASMGIISVKNSDNSFSDGNSSVTTAYKYGVILPMDSAKFGTADKISYAEFVSAWLMILGYSPESGDFLYGFPYDAAGEAGEGGAEQ